MNAVKGAMICALSLIAGAAALCSSSTLPSLEDRSVSIAYTDTDATRLGRGIAPLLLEHPGKSGIHALPDARDAFAARVLLARAAERALDVQYYIWKDDMTGTLLLEALHDAADRGVRVRLLLDDNGTSGLDATLAALDAHANIEVRLFNPFVIRTPRWIGFVADPFRLNRRMHNKSFTADNQATLIGGRNVGDEYFAATDGVVFADLDVLAVGPVAQDVSNDFDRYWASDSAYPVDRVLPPASADRIAALSASALRIEHDPAAAAYMRAIGESSVVRELLERSLPLDWAHTRMVSDDPAKGLGLAKPEALLPQQLRAIIGDPAEQLELISPYFVPTDAGVEAFAALAEQGVKIRVLTNSLDATDVALVHSGYAKRRKPLLEAGIALFELRRLSPDAPRPQGTGSSGSSGSSLHAKTFSVDRARAFIGSFNFDPRSMDLNTELGFVIDSPGLAEKIETLFDTRVIAEAYEVRLSGDGALYWIERTNGEELRHDTEPRTRFSQRAWLWLVSWLPIDSLL